jgi:hypothetical protein
MIRQVIAACILLGVVLLMAGCATTEESDIPWNSPASWEGSPFVPGLSE